MMNEKGLPAKYIPFLEHVLTPPRLKHSIGVMNVMGDLAEIYTLDRSRAMAAGLLHDAAKDLAIEYQLELAQEVQIEFLYECERHPIYLHALVGGCYVSRELNIKDDLILDAIVTHSDVRNAIDQNVLLSECLRCADVLAPIANWEGMKKLKSVVYSARIEEATLLRLGWLIEYFGECNIQVHPNLKKNFQALSRKLDVSDAFFESW